MSDNPNDKKNKDDAGLLSAAITAAPAIGGAGYTLRQMMREKQFRPPRESSFASAARRIQGFEWGDRNRNIEELISESRVFKDSGIQASTFLRTGEGGTIAKKAWDQAVRAVGPVPKKLMTFASDINATPANNVYSAIEKTLNSNTSLYMRRVASRFRQNVSAFTRHQQLTGALPNLIRAENFRFPSAVRNAQLPPELTPVFNRIKSSLGWGRADWYSRPGFDERGLGMYQMHFKHNDISFTLPVPVARNGRLVEGLNQSSLMIAPDVAVFDPLSKSITGRMSRHEFIMRDFETSILPQIQAGKLRTSWDVQKAVDELYGENVRKLQNVPNLPPHLSNQGWDAYIAQRAKAVDIRVLGESGRPGPGAVFSSAYRIPTSRELSSAMEVGGFLGSTSPKAIGTGRISEFDPRNWSMTPSAVSMARRPAQASREWRATPAAVEEMMKTKWSIFETQAWRQDMGPYAGPQFRALYVDPERHADLLHKFGLGEGESLLRRTGSNVKASEVYRAATPARLKFIRSDLKDLISSGNIKPGEVLGETIEGQQFTFRPGMQLTGLEEIATKGAGEFYSLHYNEVVRLAEHSKRFGATKGMQRLVGQDAFFSMQGKVAELTKNQFLSSGYEMIVSMDELKKDLSKHNTQMITELWNLLDTMRTRDFVRRNVKLRAFMNNPTGAANLFDKWAQVPIAGGTTYSHEKFVKNLMRFSIEEARATPEEFSSIFGAVPYVLGKDKVKGLVGNNRYFEAIDHGFTAGIGRTVFGGTKEDTGAGALGSLEPRAFEILQGGHFGEIGHDLTADMVHRLAQSNPDIFSTHKALGQTLESARGNLSTGSANIWNLSAEQYTSEGFQKWIEEGGGFLRHSGLPDIFVPGTTAAPGMAGYMTGSEDMVKSNLANIYHSYARNVSRAGSEDLRQAALKTLISDIGREHAPAGKGAGALLRGKGVLGSRFFTGVSQAGNFRPSSPFTVGLPETHAMDMISELEGIYPAEEIADMRKRFLAGEEIGGMIARHPFTDPYSLQPIKFKMMKDIKDPVITLPWFNVNLQMNGENKAIKISPLVGMGGDLDADIFSAYLVRPNIEKKIHKQLTYAANEENVAYLQHMVRAQLIKAKGVGLEAGEELIISKRAIADALKLGTAQEWVGRLSNELSLAREAVGGKLTGKEAGDARFLLNWLENVPISGKHLSPQKVLSGEMGSFFETIESGFRTRNAPRIQSAIEGMLQNADSVTKRLLTENITIDKGADEIRKLTGVKGFGNVLPSLDLPTTISNIMSSMTYADQIGATEMTKLASGRRALTEKALGKYLSGVGGLLTKNEGAFATVSAAAVAARNVAVQVGESLIKHKKAVGLGFAGSLALATILSSPKETIGPGSGIADARVDMSPGKGANRIDINPDTSQRQSLGQPSVSNMIQPSAMIAPGGDSVRMSVRARSNSRLNAGMLAERARYAGGSRNSSVNINIRDNSSSFNPHVLANKLF